MECIVLGSPDQSLLLGAYNLTNTSSERRAMVITPLEIFVSKGMTTEGKMLNETGVVRAGFHSGILALHLLLEFKEMTHV